MRRNHIPQRIDKLSHEGCASTSCIEGFLLRAWSCVLLWVLDLLGEDGKTLFESFLIMHDVENLAEVDAKTRRQGLWETAAISAVLGRIVVGEFAGFEDYSESW